MFSEGSLPPAIPHNFGAVDLDFAAMNADSRRPVDVLEELSWRGLLYQQTEGLAEALTAGPQRAYAGFDPTAPSLHVGNLVPVMGLVHLQRYGNAPLILIGGGTGMIGDPSGKASERQLNTEDVVRSNARAILGQLQKFLDFEGPAAARIDDNARWLMPLGAVEFMREVGKHFTINYMLAKDSVDSRLQTGISYTEFSYMLLQAYDFLELYRQAGVSMQIGGSDQWGNITTGIELIRRAEGGSAHGLTLPLVTTSAGTKFGKTESGSVWLDPERTSPYKFYQFWINSDDRDTSRYLRYFTLLDREEIESLEGKLEEHPEQREAQGRLASEVTSMVHGADAAQSAADISRVLFSKGDVQTLSEGALVALSREVPFFSTSSAEALGDQDISSSTGNVVADVVRLLVGGKAAASNGAARRLVDQGGVYLNGERVAADQRLVDRSRLLHGRYLLLRKGARDYLLAEIAD